MNASLAQTQQYPTLRPPLEELFYNMTSQTQYDVTTQDGFTVVRITGDLDHHNTPEFRTIVSDLITQGAKHLIVDMADVDFMDSGGMSAIIFAAKRLDQAGGHLSIATSSPQIIRKLDIGGLTKLPSLLSLHPSIQQAIQEIKQ